jgi:hypothetical protein
LAEIACADREDPFNRRRRWQVYRDRVLIVGLCQGAALHYLDGRNGAKIWMSGRSTPAIPQRSRRRGGVLSRHRAGQRLPRPR